MSGLVIVTGGSRGIGAATVRLAAARGWDVCLSYGTQRQAAADVVESCRGMGARALAVRADVSVESDVLALFDRAEESFGPVRGLVNNAGIVGKQGRLAEFEADRMARVLAVNTLGTLLCAREAVRRMGPGGAIVNVSSRAAAFGSPGEYVDYAAAKGGVDSLTVGLAKEVADAGIRVNAVRPGLIDTDIHASGGEPGRVDRVAPMVPMGRAGEPGEVAEAILWLLSPASSYTTASFVDVGGGR